MPDPFANDVHTPPMATTAPGEVIIIRAAGTYPGKQGMSLATGVSSRSAGARALCLHVVTIPPGTRGIPHLHDGHESAIHIVSGEAEVWHGHGLRRRSVVKAGDFIYVPPGIPTCRSAAATRWPSPSSPAPTRTSRKASSPSASRPTWPS
jgi:uncharacterized RmlC-like cupin family protein